MPVILEDQRMVDDNGSGNRPGEGHPSDHPVNPRAGEGNIRSGSRMYNSILCLLERAVMLQGCYQAANRT